MERNPGTNGAPPAPQSRPRVRAWLIPALALLTLWVSFATRQRDEGRRPSPLTTASVSQPPMEPSTSAPSPGDAARIVVRRAVDGDTIELESGETVRYIGVDAPESVHPRKPLECFGVESAKKNAELVESKAVRLERDVSERDRYGRLLRYVYIGEMFVNEELIRQGFAYAVTYPPDVRYQERLREAERDARAAGRGLWSGCGRQPEVLSATAPPAAAPAPLPSPDMTGVCAIKGNIAASGEKIYHVPGCGSYEKTKIDAARGERTFCSESDALAAGWRKARNCP